MIVKQTAQETYLRCLFWNDTIFYREMARSDREVLKTGIFPPKLLLTAGCFQMLRLSPGRRTLAWKPAPRTISTKASPSWAMGGKVS